MPWKWTCSVFIKNKFFWIAAQVFKNPYTIRKTTHERISMTCRAITRWIMYMEATIENKWKESGEWWMSQCRGCIWTAGKLIKKLRETHRPVKIWFPCVFNFSILTGTVSRKYQRNNLGKRLQKSRGKGEGLLSSWVKHVGTETLIKRPEQRRSVSTAEQLSLTNCY